jgi:hypothetical protein
MDSNDRKAGGAPMLVRVLVLLAVVGVAMLLTRCPLTDSADAPVPPPRAQAQ